MIGFNIGRHQPLRDIVYDEVKNRIITGEILPGERIMESNIANEMGVSRTPIREAVRKLEEENLITVIPRKGIYAAQIHINDITEILEVRQEIESYATYSAANYKSLELIRTLNEINIEYDKAIKRDNMPEMIKYDMMFHKTIVGSCKNKYLNQMFEHMQDLLFRFMYIHYKSNISTEKIRTEHQDIINAIKNGDTDYARRISFEHVGGLRLHIA